MSYESQKPCVCCGRSGEGLVCFHHLYTRKTYPEFSQKEWNQIPVCQEHHNQFHSKGNDYMASTYPSVSRWLEENNWMRLDSLKKWIHKAREI